MNIRLWELRSDLSLKDAASSTEGITRSIVNYLCRRKNKANTRAIYCFVKWMKTLSLTVFLSLWPLCLVVFLFYLDFCILTIDRYFNVEIQLKKGNLKVFFGRQSLGAQTGIPVSQMAWTYTTDAFTTTNMIKNNDSNNNKNNKIRNTKKNNNRTNEKAVNNEKPEAQLQEVRKEYRTNFSNLKKYEDQAAWTDLSQRNKSNEVINSSQINSKVTDVKWPKGTVAIVGDSMMSGIIELLKTDKHDVKVRFSRGGTTKNMEDNIKPILQKLPRKYFTFLS